MKPQVSINERNIGIKVTQAEAHSFIDILIKMGYAAVYSPTPAAYPIKIKSRDWNAAQDLLSTQVDDAPPVKPVPPVRNLKDLPLGERISTIEQILDYLTAKLEQVAA